MTKTVTDRRTGVTTAEAYTYDSGAMTNCPKAVTMTNSDGRQYTTEYTYAFESTDTLHRQMVDAYWLYDTRVKRRDLCDTTLLRETLTDYALLSSGFFLPSRVSRSLLGGEAYELYRFEAYGTKGNLKRLITNECDTADIAWNDYETLPVAYSANGKQKAEYTWKPLTGVTGITAENGYPLFYRYDNSGRLVEISDNRGTLQTFAYNTRNGGNDPTANYVRTTTWLDISGTDLRTQYTFYDGLGRQRLNASSGVGEEGRYVYDMTTYDQDGREATAWLPVAGTAKVTELDSASVVSLSKKQYDDAFAYTRNHYDGLDRVTLSETAGEVWHKAGKTVTTEYLTNGEVDVKRYDAPLDSISLQKAGYYAPHTLLATRTTDEDGHTLTVYTDKLGRKILERRGKDNDTYFIYDVLGQLRYVLSPEYQNAGYKAKYAYEYRYDDRGNVVKKILPQCGTTQYWYDRTNRQTFMQDDMLKAQGRYRFTLYDNQGRVAVVGMCGSCDRSFMGVLSLPTVTYTKKKGVGGSGYTLCSKGLIGERNLTIETVNYYDGYDFLTGCHKSDYAPISTTSGSIRTQGLLTGSITAASNSGYLYKVYTYDAQGRIVETQSTMLNDGTEIIKNDYNYAGQPINTYLAYCCRQKKHVNAHIENYYLHQSGKVKESYLNIHLLEKGEGMTGMTAQYSYDTLGRLSATARYREAGTVSYTYNLHGWTTSIETPSFKEYLHYADPTTATPCYNGDISLQQWSNGNYVLPRRYQYTYDALDRLTDAIYSEGETGQKHQNRFNEQILEYTANGVIKRLQRRGLKQDGEYGKTDNLNITLDGNRPVKVVDDAEPLYYEGAFDFVDDDNTQDIEYTYNAVGALTSDRNRGINQIEYDNLNNPRRIHFTDGSTTEYVYSVTGEKLRTIHCTPAAQSADTTDYVGALILKNGQPAMYLFDGGYASLDEPYRGKGSVSIRYHFYNRDHLGNIREVVNEQGELEQVINYYPYGTPFSDRDGVLNSDFQPYKYSSKELDLMYGLNTYDFGARQYNPLLGVWDRMDSFAEKYYHLSPYSLCENTSVY